MATPTPSKLPNQDLTPGTFASHLAAFSPPNTSQRSHGQSPAYYKKSPASAAFLQHTANAGLGGGALSFDSPTASALGLTLNHPALGNLPQQYARPDDEEFKRRIETILAKLKGHTGRISGEGIELLAKKVGLESFWETLEGGERGLTIGGTTLLIEVYFKNDAVTRLNLSFPQASDLVSSSVSLAADILKQDLTPAPGTAAMNSSLSEFGANLERLAKLDRLSVAPTLNCYEAITGIHKSLQKLYDYEVKQTKESFSRKRKRNTNHHKQIEREVLCKKSGRPTMHASRTVGLKIDYWMRQRLVGDQERHKKDDIVKDSTNEEHKIPPGHDIWSAVIECESSPAELYRSIRVSDQWISDKIEADPNDVFSTSGGSSIDWQDPPPTLLSSGGDGMENGLGGNPPNVRFVARLQPPVVVPLQVAYEIFSSVETTFNQEPLTLLDELLLPRGDDETPAVEGETRHISTKKSVQVYNENNSKTVRYHYSTYVLKQDYGRLIEEIPFYHPRQLIAILPILRQYASLSNILQSTLSQPPKIRNPKPSVGPKDFTEDEDFEIYGQDSEDDLLTDFLTGKPISNDSLSEESLPVDINFIMQGLPKLGITYPHDDAAQHVALEICLNGDLKAAGIGDASVGFEAEDVTSPKRADRAARALDVCEDVGTLIEYLKR